MLSLSVGSLVLLFRLSTFLIIYYFLVNGTKRDHQFHLEFFSLQIFLVHFCFHSLFFLMPWNVDLMFYWWVTCTDRGWVLFCIDDFWWITDCTVGEGIRVVPTRLVMLCPSTNWSRPGKSRTQHFPDIFFLSHWDVEAFFSTHGKKGHVSFCRHCMSIIRRRCLSLSPSVNFFRFKQIVTNSFGYINNICVGVFDLTKHGHHYSK